MLTRFMKGIGYFCLAAAMAPWAHSQSSKNPEISVIGDTRLVWSDDIDKVSLEFEELEIALVGALNPYAYGEVYLGIHGIEGIEVEEAKLSLDRYFPGGIGLTGGVFLLDFSQINQAHLHAYPWVFRPLMHTEFFSSDGIRDVSARLDWIAPIEAFTLRASVGAVRGDVFLEGHHHEDEHEALGRGIDGQEAEPEEEEANPELGVTGRVEAFLEPSDELSFLVGVAGMHGKYDTIDGAAATWINLDLKSKLYLGSQSTLTLIAETTFGQLEASEESPESSPMGWFTAAEYRLSPWWNFGGFAESTTEKFDQDHSTSRFGGFLGLALMEESTVFRVVGDVTDYEDSESVFGVTLQAIFGLGPHRPHKY